MTRKLVLLLLASACLTSFAAATDARLVSLLDPQNRVVAGLNATAIKSSSFGQYLIAHSASSGLARFVTATGFDPRTNLQQVLFGSVGGTGKAQRVLLVEGSFVPAKILAYAGSKGATLNSYRTVKVAELAAFQDKRGRQHPARWLAFLSTTIAAFGSPESVQRAIDRSLDKTAADAGLSARIAAASAGYGAWYQSTVPGAEASLSIPQSSNELAGLAANALQAVQSESVGVKFGAGALVRGQAVTSSDQEAVSLAERLRYMASVAATQASQKQKTTAANVLQKISVSTQGPLVNWTVQIPESQLETMTRLHAAPQGGK